MLDDRHVPYEVKVLRGGFTEFQAKFQVIFIITDVSVKNANDPIGRSSTGRKLG